MSLVVVPRDARTLIVMRASVSRRPIPPPQTASFAAGVCWPEASPRKSGCRLIQRLNCRLTILTRRAGRQQGQRNYSDRGA
jgi:hypothetical protein